MPVSLHELIELNGRRPALNRFFKFFEYEGRSYGYMNRMPFRISFISLSSELIRILKEFDGSRTVNEVVVSNSLDTSFFELLKFLYRNSVLKEHEKKEEHKDSSTLSLTFFPTNNCNLRCVYCYAFAGDTSPATIDMDKAGIWIDYALNNRNKNVKKVKVVFHGGGEPTSAFRQMKAIWEMVKSKCANEGIETTLESISNGNFDESVLEWFINEKAFVYFSLDGINEVNDRLRPRADGRGSFRSAYKNIKKIKSAGFTTGIRCTITGTNKSELINIIDFAKENKLDFVHLGMYSEYGRSEGTTELKISEEEYRGVYLDAWKYALASDIRMAGLPVLAVSPGRRNFCSSYEKQTFSVTPEGYLSHCPEVSLKSDPAAEVFFTGEIKNNGDIEFYEDKIAGLKQRNKAQLPECTDCYLQFTCNGGCVVKSFRKTGSLTQPDDAYCRMIRGLSFEILETLLKNPGKVDKKYYPEYLEYSDKIKTGINAEVIVFNPLV